MNSKERVKAVMELKTPDRVPLLCQFSIGHMLRQLDESPVLFWFDVDTYVKGLLKLREIYNFDGILISLHGHSDKWKDEINGFDTYDDFDLIEWKNGDSTKFLHNDLPVHTFKEERIFPEISTFDINTIPKVLDYIPVSQDLYFPIDLKDKFKSINKIIEKCGKDYSIHGEITSPFDYYLDLFGHQDSLLNLLFEPDKVKEILQHFTVLVKNLAVEMCHTGIDAIKLSSPFAGAGFISPDSYREFVLPYEKQIAEAIRNNGVHIYTHTCGSINDRLELMFEAGISGIECLDPPPLGDVELDDAFERIPSTGFIKGNIDSIASLLSGTREEVINDAKNRLQIGMKYKNFILSTACSIAPDVKRENIQALYEAVTKYGNY
ncbi:MAG TPA: uroporphyrinogen decarboxylase family protein [Ignavibacteriaceae bacterium]|nr:uroporphyrinogen decarboxylase family protein [Ignavibacteriaceae bacterium]